jgi:drug/metabolite transporter (DMT)-like permease
VYRLLTGNFESATLGDEMKAYTVAAIVLIVAGILGLVYGQFSYTKESQGAKLGPIELTINEKKSVNIPQWAGVGSIVAGAAILVLPLIKK